MLLFMIALLIGLGLYANPTAVHATTFVVDTTSDTVDVSTGDGVCADSNGNCSLRAAIMEANASSGDDVITLPAGTYTLALIGVDEDGSATGDLDITDNLTINGAGANVTIIDGNQIDRVLHINPGALSLVTVQINDVKITGGKAPDGATGFDGEGGGGIYNEGTLTLNRCIISNNATGNGNSGADGGNGGGIYNADTLTINDSTISSNSTGNGNGNDGYGGHGGGIYNEYQLTLNNSTVSGNSTGNGDTNGAGGSGGGISNADTLVMNNCTVSGNSTGIGGNSGGAGGSGGGIENWAYASITLTNCTITSNSVGSGGTGGVSGEGGGVYNEANGTLTIKNTLIAGNTDSGGETPDCYGAPTSQGYNLIGDGTGCNFTAQTGDQVGTSVNPIDPLLGSLADNGGPAYTHALQSGSPAIDAIPTTSGQCTAGDKDQRYALRASGNDAGGTACDIGAYEVSNTFQQDITELRTYVLHKTRIQVSALGTLSQITALYVPSNHPNAPATVQTGQYWTFTSNDGASGFTLNITLPLNQTPSQDTQVCYYTGVDQTWDCVADSFDTTYNTVTRNALTHLSDWAVGNSAATAVTLRSLAAGTAIRSAESTRLLTLLALVSVAYLLQARRQVREQRHRLNAQ